MKALLKRPIKEVIEDHPIFKALADNDPDKVIEHLLKYRELLTDHIKKEDEVLYPWIERQMASDQIEAMHRAFLEEESRRGPETSSKYENLIEELENKLFTREEVQS